MFLDKFKIKNKAKKKVMAEFWKVIPFTKLAFMGYKISMQRPSLRARNPRLYKEWSTAERVRLVGHTFQYVGSRIILAVKLQNISQLDFLPGMTVDIHCSCPI